MAGTEDATPPPSSISFYSPLLASEHSLSRLSSFKSAAHLHAKALIWRQRTRPQPIGPTSFYTSKLILKFILLNTLLKNPSRLGRRSTSDRRIDSAATSTEASRSSTRALRSAPARSWPRCAATFSQDRFYDAT